MSVRPKGVQFKTIKPQGFFQEYRDYTVTPNQTYTNQFSISDIIRIQFNLQDWYLDPYESFIEAEVRLRNESAPNFTQNADFTQLDQGIKFYMMDGPSTSLINDYRLEVNSKEIERIREYDQVGNLLTDLNLYPAAVDQKDYEGYYSINNPCTIANAQQQYRHSINQSNFGTASAYSVGVGGASCPIFTQIPSISYISSGEPVMVNSATSVFNGLGSSVSDDLNLNTLQLAGIEQSVPALYTGTRNNNTATGTLQSAADTRIGSSAAGSKGQQYNYSSYLGGLTASNSNYGISSDIGNSAGVTTSGFIPVTDSPKMQQIDGHNIFLTNMPTSKIVNGQFRSQMYNAVSNAPADTSQTRAYMQIPLLSGVMGVLIPSERWQLIPTSSLGQVNMEFRLNPNAFFSHDGQQPDWIINKFQLRLRLYRFDAAMMAQLKTEVAAGIQLHSQIFSMGPIYNIQPSTSVTNNWQLNNGIPSIKQLFFWFLSQDHEFYWHARKNFKVCQNITSMQLKIGSTYVPQNPIIGHAGNIVMNSFTPYDNSVYLSELHQAMNVFLDCKKHININKVNFAVNQRPYDVTLANPLGLGALSAKKMNMIKSAGYTLWNEMRCRGKAVYAFNIEMDKKNDDTMTGIDTTKVRPIELILKSDDPNVYTRQSTMYVMFLSDFVVTFNANETNTEGAG